jgi:hypothetical protein
MSGRIRGLDAGTVFTPNPERIDRVHAEGNLYGQSRGGVAFRGRVVGRPGRAGDGSTANPPQNSNTTLNARARGGYYRESYYIAPANGWVNWTAAGPIRRIIREWNYNYRPVVASPRWQGLHTNIPIQPRDQAGRARMQARRQNRLTVQRFRGQTYSQTTKLQGA